MEEKLLEIFKLADELNDKQDKLFAQINYRANDDKKLVIEIISKKTWTYIMRIEVFLNKNSLIKWDNIIEVLKKYAGGVTYE